MALLGQEWGNLTASAFLKCMDVTHSWSHAQGLVQDLRLYLAKLEHLICRKAIVLGTSCTLEECTDIV